MSFGSRRERKRRSVIRPPLSCAPTNLCERERQGGSRVGGDHNRFVGCFLLCTPTNLCERERQGGSRVGGNHDRFVGCFHLCAPTKLCERERQGSSSGGWRSQPVCRKRAAFIAPDRAKLLQPRDCLACGGGRFPARIQPAPHSSSSAARGSSPRSVRALRAAACSASFLLAPQAAGKAASPMTAATWKHLEWSGPCSSMRR